MPQQVQIVRIGFSGFSGFSGGGATGTSGYSGFSAISGYSGYSGFSGSGRSGYSGFSGRSGYSGFSGFSGFSGRSGYSGFSGFSGFSGSNAMTSGYSGFSGKSGYSGYSGYSGPADLLQNAQPNDYTFVLADDGKHIFHDSASTHTYTIPANASVAFPIGATITIVNDNGSGNLTLAITSDTLRRGDGTAGSGSRTIAADSMATILKTKSTEWYIIGAFT